MRKNKGNYGRMEKHVDRRLGCECKERLGREKKDVKERSKGREVKNIEAKEKGIRDKRGRRRGERTRGR